MQETRELLSVEDTKFIAEYEALKRLEQNEDFQTLILKGYLGDKALSSVSLLSRPDIKKRNERGDVIEDLVAISNLQYYLYLVTQMGKRAIEEANESIGEE